MIPVIDVFAGPGGLGEGFSSWKDARGSQRFSLSASFEMNPEAHATLRLRAFRRCFDGMPPAEYSRLLVGESNWVQLSALHPKQAEKAEREARRVTLGEETSERVRKEISEILPADDRWVLIGGPPCQAYSLAGRARNKGKIGYSAELDHRQKLYVEYLQVLGDHAPPVFVMENVKGLLSATVNKLGMFERIRDDLRDPATALSREGRHVGTRRPRYEIQALARTSDLLDDDPAGYVVETERFGIPQRRHRVILVGIRQDYSSGKMGKLQLDSRMHSVEDAIGDLPRLRSGLSKQPDSGPHWRAHLFAVRKKEWMRKIDSEIRQKIEAVVDNLTIPVAARGHDHFYSRSGNIILNHSSRSHIGADLERYLFASAFASVNKTSPRLAQFPRALLPLHGNVEQALGNGLFADRFRVQLKDGPSTTITSHISKDGHYYIHHDPSQCRSITVREAARLQTFPDDYFFCGPRTAQYQQVGNAVPPALARQIASLVSHFLA